MTEFKYSPDQASKIANELPKSASSRRVISALESVARDYLRLRESRGNRNSKFVRARLVTVRNLTAELQRALQATANIHPFKNFDEVEKIVRLLALLNRRIGAQIEGHSALLRAYSRKADPARDAYFEKVARIWTGIGRGARAVSTDLNGKRRGPMLRFFRAAVGPILSPQSISDETIAKFIKKKPRPTKLP